MERTSSQIRPRCHRRKGTKLYLLRQVATSIYTLLCLPLLGALGDLIFFIIWVVGCLFGFPRNHKKRQRETKMGNISANLTTGWVICTFLKLYLMRASEECLEFPMSDAWVRPPTMTANRSSRVAARTDIDRLRAKTHTAAAAPWASFVTACIELNFFARPATQLRWPT